MNRKVTLTKREAQIAEYLAWGATKKEIAMILCISVRTVENIARSIFEKTEVTKASELSAWWFCVRFDISFDLNPIKRRIIAIALLIMTIPQVFALPNTSDMQRPNRASRTMRTSRSSRVRRDTLINSDLYEL